jgi:RimJ/RimL family protein N-acetyltransferase
MPTMRQHKKFVDSNPYRAWYFMEVERYHCIVGTCYLTKQNEIGVQIFKEDQGNGYGPQAIKLLMAKHGGRRYLANINPANERSAKMFKALGFNLISYTYARET